MTDVAWADILGELRRQRDRANADAQWWLKRFGRTGNLGLAISAHKVKWLDNEIIPACERIATPPGAQTE